MRREPPYRLRSLLLSAVAAVVIPCGDQAVAQQAPAPTSAPAASPGQQPATPGQQPAAPKPPAPSQQSAPPGSELKNLETIPANAVIAILGKDARDPSGHDMGPVVDVLVGRDGLPRAAIIDFGGFLGVGSRKIAIDWSLLQFVPDDAKAPIVLSLDRAMVQAAPEYKPSAQQPMQVVGPLPDTNGPDPAGGK
jgi:hypothetical protein